MITQSYTLSLQPGGVPLRVPCVQGDTSSRATWYRAMSELSVFSPDDIAALEDLPNIPGGNRRRASLNYVPLDLWPELSKQRHGGIAAGEE